MRYDIWISSGHIYANKGDLKNTNHPAIFNKAIPRGVLLDGKTMIIFLLNIFKTLIMKFLKVKLGLFSLLTVLAVSVFLTSCDQQEAIVPDTINGVNELNESVMSDVDAIVFTLPEQFNDMSEEELDAFLENISDEELEELQIPMKASEVDFRGCGGWTYQGTRCRNSHLCNSNRGEFKAYRRWCWGWISGYKWSYDRIGCCN